MGEIRSGLRVLLVGCLWLAPGLLRAAAPNPGAMVVVQVPVDLDLESGPPVAGGMLRADHGDGGRIVRVGPGAEPHLLTAGFHSAADPDVSFDGERIVFAGKREAGDPWNVFEMRLDGSELRQVTRCTASCRGPVYQGTTYRISAERPWRELTFVSTRAGEINEYGSAPSTSLYSVEIDGSNVRRLTFNPSSDMDPAVLPDGRLVFSSWQRRTLDRGDRGRIALFAAQTDGLDYALFAGDPGRRIKHMPCVTADRLVLFVESDSVPWDGAGTLASVSLRRNLHSYRSVTGEEDGLFVFPSPLPDGKVLVSRRPARGGGTHGVVSLDPRTGTFEPVFDDPAFHDIQAVAAAPRAEPDGRSSVVSDDEPTGSFYCLSVHETDVARETWVAPGSRPRLRVLEGVPATTASGVERIEEAPALLPRRVLGEIAVEEDGSFHVRVPAGLPIELQLLDDDGVAVRTCGWIWVGNRETRGCIGCHEDPERAPENRLAEALARPAIDLTPPPAARRTVDFGRDVLPIVSARCATATCHGAPDARPSLGGDAEALDVYRALLDVDDRGRSLHVDPGRARTSRLIEHLRPSPRTPAEKGRGVLTDDEIRTLVEWIDLGAAWGAPSDGSQPGGTP